MDAATQLSKDTLTGALVAGKYRVLRPLGRGIFGTVYLCRRAEDRRLLALKLSHPQLVASDDFRSQLLDEMGAASQLQLPSIVPILEFGEDLELGRFYIVMPYVDARDLGRVLHEDAPLTETRIRGIVVQVLEALCAAAALEVLHLDLKPSNIFVHVESDVSDRVLVGDFGCARLAPQSGSERTGTRLIGTPEYGSPEHARGELLDTRSDIYAMGVILYELLTGRLPFHTSNPIELGRLHCGTPPLPPSGFRSVDHVLESVCLKALSKTPEARFQTAREMLDALEMSRPRVSMMSFGRKLGATNTSDTRPLADSAARTLPSKTALAPALASDAAVSEHKPKYGSLAPTARVVPRTRESIPKRHAGVALIAGASLAGVVWAGYSQLAPTQPHGTHAELVAIAERVRPVTQPELLALDAEPSLPDSVELPVANPVAPVPIAKPIADAPVADTIAETSAPSTASAHADSHAPLEQTAQTRTAANFASTAHPQPSAASDPVSPVQVSPEQVSPVTTGRARIVLNSALLHPAVSTSLLRVLDEQALLDCYRASLAAGTSAATSISGRLDLETSVHGRIRWARFHAPLPQAACGCFEKVALTARLPEAPGATLEASVLVELHPE